MRAHVSNIASPIGALACGDLVAAVFVASSIRNGGADRDVTLLLPKVLLAVARFPVLQIPLAVLTLIFLAPPVRLRVVANGVVLHRA
jgi:hypothetical protein